MKAHGKSYEYCTGGKPEFERDIHIIEMIQSNPIILEVEVTVVHTVDEALKFFAENPKTKNRMRVVVHDNFNPDVRTNEQGMSANAFIATARALGVALGR